MLWVPTFEKNTINRWWCLPCVWRYCVFTKSISIMIHHGWKVDGSNFWEGNAALHSCFYDCGFRGATDLLAEIRPTMNGEIRSHVVVCFCAPSKKAPTCLLLTHVLVAYSKSIQFPHGVGGSCGSSGLASPSEQCVPLSSWLYIDII